MAACTAVFPLDPDERPCKVPWRVAYRGCGSILHLTFRDLEVDEEDIGPLREAFEGCSPDELLAAILRHEVGWRIRADALESRAYAMLMRKMIDALDAMLEIERTAPCADRDRVVGPLWRFVANGSQHCLEHSVGAALYVRDRSEAVNGLLHAGVERVRTWDELRELQRGLDANDELGEAGMPAFEGSIAALSQLPWDEALALPLWLPKGLSDRERYAVLARAFWALTYRGFSRDEQRRSVVDASHGGEARKVRIAQEPWPSDPVRALLEHACWVDALEMHDALFTVLMPSGNTPVTEGRCG